MKNKLIQKFCHTLELVKFSHTIFALPFVMVAYLSATKGQFRPHLLFWILLCLVLARTAAMAFNRLVDAKLDGENPRTQNRHLPLQQLSRTYVLGLTIFSTLGFMAAARQINLTVFSLSPFCLAILFFYSLTKRFTHYTQLFLGLALGLAPLATQLAVTGNFSWPAICLSFAVFFWVAGFDLLYALQDLAFDQTHRIFSLPVKLGIKKTFLLSRIFHLFFLVALVIFGLLQQLGILYWIGSILAGMFLFWQHWLLKSDLSKIQMAFFTANGLLSLVFGIFASASLIYK